MKRILAALAATMALAVALGLLVPQGTQHTAAPPPRGVVLYGGRTHSTAFLNSVEHPQGVALSPRARTAATPTVPGYDAVTPGNLPLGARAVLCYADGRYANCGAVRLREPQARLITVDVRASGPVARILDTEPGDATPSQDAGWIRRMIAAHVYRPGVYSDAAEMPTVKADLAAAGLARSEYALMLADWNGHPPIPPGYDAIQWRSTATLDYDTFSASFFATRPKPKPDPFAIYPLAKVTLYHQKVSERLTVQTWWAHHCENPVRRSVCRSTRRHLVWLEGRLDRLGHLQRYHRGVRRWRIHHILASRAAR